MSRADALERMATSRDESTEVHSLLEAGIADDVADYDFGKGLATHLAAVAAPPVGSGTTAAPAAGVGAPLAAALAPKALLLWIGIPVASLGLAAAVLLSQGHDSAAPSGTASPHVALAPAASPAAGADSPAQGAAEPTADEAPADENASAGASRTPRSSRSAAVPRHAAAQSGAIVLEETEPSRAPATGEGASNGPGIVRSFPEGEPAPSPVASSPASAKAAPTVDAHRSEQELARAERAREESRRESDDKLQREMDELMRAKRALPSDPKLALELAQHGDREFSQGLLGEERRHVLLLALIGLGRVSEAERLAAPYLAKHPDSPFAKRVRAALDAAAKRRVER